MESTAFQQRKARILAARAAAERRRNRPRGRRALGLAMALAGSLACFFLLKGATLAYLGEAGFARLAPDDGRPASQIGYWLAGPDPVTRVIAETLRPGMQRS